MGPIIESWTSLLAEQVFRAYGWLRYFLPARHHNRKALLGPAVLYQHHPKSRPTRLGTWARISSLADVESRDTPLTCAWRRSKCLQK